jgi:hypothetical protein
MVAITYKWFAELGAAPDLAALHCWCAVLKFVFVVAIPPGR